MIFSTISQLNCVLIFCFFGIVCSIVLTSFSILFVLNFHKNFIKTLINMVIYIIFSIFFVILLNFFNFGNFSLTLFIVYSLSFITFKILSRKSVVFLQTLWYNKIKKIFKRKTKGKNLSNEISSKS